MIEFLDKTIGRGTGESRLAPPAQIVTSGISAWAPAKGRM